MEHAKEPQLVYKDLSLLLKKNGLMFHDIEFHSHGITKIIDRHFHLNPVLWKIIFGNRKYYLNNYPPHYHLTNFQTNNLIVIGSFFNSEKSCTKDNLTSEIRMEQKKYLGASFLLKNNNDE